MFFRQFTLILYNLLLATCCCFKDNIISTKFVPILMYHNQVCYRSESLQKLHSIVDFFLNVFKKFSEIFFIAPVIDCFCSWFCSNVFILNIKGPFNASSLCCKKIFMGRIGKGKHWVWIYSIKKWWKMILNWVVLVL